MELELKNNFQCYRRAVSDLTTKMVGFLVFEKWPNIKLEAGPIFYNSN